MKILLVCAGGFSTTMMMGTMKKIIIKSEKLNIEDFTPMEAIPVDILESKINDFDIVLVGPQLGHKFDEIKKIANERNKASLLLTSEIYGAMDGATVLKQAILEHRKYNQK